MVMVINQDIETTVVIRNTIIEWSSDPVVYISHALSPSDVLTVSVDEEKVTDSE